MNALEESAVPLWYKPISPNYLRRAVWHDYRSRCAYMITLSKHHDLPVLSSLSQSMLEKPGIIYPELSLPGIAICRAFKDFQFKYPFLKVGRYVVMPDHIHFVIEALEILDRHFGFYLNKLKTECSMRYWIMMGGDPAGGCGSVFEDGYNDKILRRKNQWNVWNEYIADNPRRLLVRRHLPEFFRRGRIVIAGTPREYSCYGNQFLLDYPDKRLVKFSRRFTREDTLKWRKSCLENSDMGTVLVSPFIHPEEKSIGNEVVKRGGKIIQIVENPFGDREKPERSRFNLCESGSLLIISLNGKKVDYPDNMTYNRASELNKFARKIVDCSMDGLIHRR